MGYRKNIDTYLIKSMLFLQIDSCYNHNQSKNQEGSTLLTEKSQTAERPKVD